MIVYDLHCTSGHRFEGWFSSSSDYESQRESGFLSCPVCGSLEVSKAPMAPAVPVKGNTQSIAPGKERAEEAPAGSTAMANREIPPQVQEAMQKLAVAQAKALETSTWVGKDFAAQSREMHYGERDEAPIHGQASLKEAKELIDEGVPVAPLPFPIAPPDEVN